MVRFLLHISAPLQSVILERDHTSFPIMFAGFTGESYPIVWPVLGKDVETGSDQSHAAAEAGQLLSNRLLPKLVCCVFSCKHGSPVCGGSCISPGVSTWSCAGGYAFFWSDRLCAAWTFPLLCLTSLNFFGWNVTAKDSQEFLLQHSDF